MDKQILQNFCEDYKNGDSLRNLSKKYGFCISLLHYHLNNKGIIRKKNIIYGIKSNNELLIGTFIGFWIGDGSKFKEKDKGYTIKFYLDRRDIELLKFIKKLLLEIFDKDRIELYFRKGTNTAIIKFRSKFIYYFIDEYVSYERNKTLTIRLKKSISTYSEDFIKGLLLGFTLSDGSIKHIFSFTTISKSLVDNLDLILKKFGYNPKIYLQKAHGYGKHPFYNVVLRTQESRLLKGLLDNLIVACDFKGNINALKRYS